MNYIFRARSALVSSITSHAKSDTSNERQRYCCVYVCWVIFFSFVYIAFVLAFEKNQERNEQQQQRE